jgi:hypothetical protein
MIALVAAALLAAQPACAAPPGAAGLLDQPQQIIVVGETHGTVEAPAAFLGIVCEAARRGPVTVGLEMPESDQALLDFVMEADDEATAARILRGGDFGDPRRNDGRHSQAMFEMILGFWRLKAAGHDIALRPFAPRMAFIRGRSQGWWELEMGYRMSRPLVERPEARLLILVGDLHARKAGYGDRFGIGLPAAGHLHGGDTLTLHIARQGGQSWSCQPDCGVQQDPAAYDPDVRGVVLQPFDNGAYDGVLAVGPTTASPPVAEDQPSPISSGSSS